VKVARGYKTEVNPTPEHVTLFCQYAGCARFAYNYGLRRKQEAYKAGQRIPSAIDLQKELNRLKQTEYPWLHIPSKWVVQNALRDLDTAFKYFFRKVHLKKQGKHTGTCGYPRFKSKHKGRGAFRLDGPVHVFEDRVQLPRIGQVRLKEHGYLPTEGKILSATVSEHAGRWYVSVLVEQEVAEPVPATGTPVGIDLGIKTLATCSDGTTFENPKALRSRLKALRRASRQHSRKQKGSNNCKKAHKRLARLHRKIANIRQDALHQATSQMAAKTKSPDERPSVLVVEDLNVQGMLKNRKLSRAIADVGMYEFKRQLRYKAAWNGIQVKEVSRWYPSSKTCSRCGAIREELGLDERVFVCHVCGYVADRDYNAALNLVALAY
jgi:putative transposase